MQKAYENIDSNKQTSQEAIITEIIADVFEVKNRSEVESYNNRKEE